ncbi:hypothetical protein E2C01_092197 [Portunus trituberculatus]|uniref:Uncharacterized protein n=1 Tax=Portunus trituberculatus TaxID=210409 RepID=A0A5B7JRD4_PORTR|nr:hypothetical protein [Portunus trituberculatus]
MPPLLGVVFDNFRPHVRSLRERLLARIRVLRFLSRKGTGASLRVLRNIYLAVEEAVKCNPDLPLCDYMPHPPWCPAPFTITTFPHARPKALHLRQEAIELVVSCTTPGARHYYTDGSVSAEGAAVAAFVCREVTVAHHCFPSRSHCHLPCSATCQR